MSESALASKKCIPCEVGTQPLINDDLKKLLPQVPQWELALEGRAIKRRFTFKDFMSALSFVEQIAPIAESQGHHPDLMLGWGYVECILWTHVVAGLHENDFIMASKINQLPYNE